MELCQRSVTVTKDHQAQLNSLKSTRTTADLCLHMVNPVSSANQLQANEAAQPAAAPKAQPQQSTKLPSDTVSLKSTGDVNHDGDSH